MAEADQSARTMRIDIHPDFRSETLRRKREQLRRSASDETSIIARRVRSQSQSSPYKKLLQGIYDATLITNNFGRIFDYNHRAVEFFFASGDALAGSNVLDRISGADESLLDEIHHNLHEHRYTMIEAMCVRIDGSTFPAEIAVNKIDLDEEGQLCFFIRDITVRKRAQEALEDAVERLEQHDRSRSQFVSNVSHELRTPLTSMIYAVSNLLRGVAGPLTDSIRKYLEMLDGDCRRLLGTVNDILDLRKIENRSLSLSRATIPFARLVERSVESLRVQVEQKRQSLTVNLHEGHWFVNCDVQKMERVLLNLMGNAIKFTMSEGHLVVDLRGDLRRDGNVLLSIQDDGIGIPSDALPHVAERYFTVGDQACGSGLGLAISKEIVNLHEGSMQIESPPADCDNGTVVFVSLPTVAPPTVVVAEDDPSVRKLLSAQIEPLGYRVVTAGSGADLWPKLDVAGPKLLLLDLVLPDVEGSEIILKMKSEKQYARIPVIVVTGANVSRAKAHILSSFSIPALGKPWSEDELLDRIEGAFLGVAALGGRTDG